MYRPFHDYRDSKAINPLSSEPRRVIRGAKPIRYLVSAAVLFTLCNAGGMPAFAADASSIAIRVNTGGGKFTDSKSNVWSADTGFNTGNTSAWPTKAVNGTVDDVLFQSERWDPSTAPELEYSFPVPNGDYKVNLYFAEMIKTASGKRVFHVNLEGQRVLTDLDIYREAGPAAALVKSFTTKVTDGKLNIVFLHKTENPKISAIEILGIGSTAVTPTNGTVTIDAGTSVNVNVLGGTTGGTVTLVSSPYNGTASVQSNNTIKYVPKSNYVGQDSITYKITDKSGAVKVATLTFNVGCTSCGIGVNLAVSWAPSAGEVLGYRVYYGPTSGTVSQQMSDLDAGSGEIDPKAPSVTYSIAPTMGLHAGDTACFRVKAYNKAGESGFSVPACKTI